MNLFKQFGRLDLRCEFGGGGAPATPASPPPPAAPPTASTFEAQQASRETLVNAQKKKGVQASILAGNTGAGQGQSSGATLLGDVGFKK